MAVTCVLNYWNFLVVYNSMNNHCMPLIVYQYGQAMAISKINGPYELHILRNEVDSIARLRLDCNSAASAFRNSIFPIKTESKGVMIPSRTRFFASRVLVVSKLNIDLWKTWQRNIAGPSGPLKGVKSPGKSFLVFEVAVPNLDMNITSWRDILRSSCSWYYQMRSLRIQVSKSQKLFSYYILECLNNTSPHIAFVVHQVLHQQFFRRRTQHHVCFPLSLFVQLYSHVDGKSTELTEVLVLVECSTLGVLNMKLYRTTGYKREEIYASLLSPIRSWGMNDGIA